MTTVTRAVLATFARVFIGTPYATPAQYFYQDLTSAKNPRSFEVRSLTKSSRQDGSSPKNQWFCWWRRWSNSLGNHTVNNLHSFGVVFVDSGKEDFIFKTFAKIFWIRLGLPHFSCIHFFCWKANLPGEILDLLSKMSSKTWLYKCYVFGLSVSLWLPHVFDDIFDSKFNISPRRFVFQ